MGRTKACTSRIEKVLENQGLINGERGGIRTLGHLIKSQVLYQLSYALNQKYGHDFIPLIAKSQSFFYKKTDIHFFDDLFQKIIYTKSHELDFS